MLLKHKELKDRSYVGSVTSLVILNINVRTGKNNKIRQIRQEEEIVDFGEVGSQEVAAEDGAVVKQVLGEVEVGIQGLEEEEEGILVAEASLEIGSIDLEVKIRTIEARVPIIQQQILVNSTDFQDLPERHQLIPHTQCKKKIRINWIPVS